MSQLVGLGILLGLFLLPWFLRKRYPVATVSIYWILFTYLPTQVLPFSYPVADRYLLLPSVGVVILIAWLLIKATNHLHRWNVAAATTLGTALSFIWLMKTVNYLSEWQDPRSVWFAATQKSGDFHVYYELGWEYLEKRQVSGQSEETLRFPQRKQSITPRLFGRQILSFRNYSLSYPKNSVTDQLKMRLRNICRLERLKILIKPSQEKARISRPPFFLAAECFSLIKVICSLQRMNSWRSSKRHRSYLILKLGTKQ